MAPTHSGTKTFAPGTTGWTVDDLDEPEIERRWLEGSFEIVDGVLAIMPAAYFGGGEALVNLLYILKTHFKGRALSWRVSVEVDVVLTPTRVAKVDAVVLSPADQGRQKAASRRAGRKDWRRARILVPPSLVIESVSEGHEIHDHGTKRRWYAEAGVPHYWILDSARKTLDCLSLTGEVYDIDANGRGAARVRPSLFPGLVIALAEVWGS